MSLGATALGDAALGSTAGTEQTATASLAASDGDRSTAAGARGVEATTTAADADRAATVGVLGVAGVVTVADADAGTLAGVRTLAATTTAQDADAGSLAAQTGASQTAALAVGDADAATIAGVRALDATPTASDGDRGAVAARQGVTAAAVGADAEAATVAGGRTRLATPTATDADRGAFGVVRNPTTQTVERTLDWRAVYQRALHWRATQARTLDIDTMSDIQPHDHYLAGESEAWEFDIQKDGSDYDVSSATVAWYLLPLGSSDPADAVLSDSDAGVTLAVSDADSDGTSERVTLEIDQGVTDDLDGYYTQLLVVDDSGPGLAKFAGDFPIEEI
jgi:hypothetical protein